jgi:hypothetical protein
LGVNGYDYSVGIMCNIPAIIANNIIDCCFGKVAGASGGFGIYFHPYVSGSANTVSAKICDNIINRGSTTISSYIQVTGSTKIKSLQIIDNMFDSHTIDGSSTNVIIFDSNAYKALIQRNTNQTFTLDGMSQTFTLGWDTAPTAGPDYDLMKALYVRSGRYKSECLYQMAGSTGRFAGQFVIYVQPIEGARPISVSMDVWMKGSTGQYDVRCYSQTTEGTSEREALVLDGSLNFLSSQYTVSNSPAARAATATFTTHVVSLDPTFCNTSYPNTFSANRSIPVYFYLIDPATSSRCDLTTSDKIYIKNINITYRY